MLTNPIVVIILQYISDQINTLHILNLHNVICQLYLKETGKQVEDMAITDKRGVIRSNGGRTAAHNPAEGPGSRPTESRCKGNGVKFF